MIITCQEFLNEFLAAEINLEDFVFFISDLLSHVPALEFWTGQFYVQSGKLLCI